MINEPHERQDERISQDELVLHAFGELPPDRIEDAERLIREDPRAHAMFEAMRRLARSVSEDPTAPSEALLAATRAGIELAAIRKARWRRIRIVAAVSSMAAAAIVLAVALVPRQSPQGTPVAERPRPAAPTRIASRPAVAGLSEADRRVLRQTVARMRRERSWDDALGVQVARLRRQIDAARLSSSRFWPTPRRDSRLHRRMERPSDRPSVLPRATQPAGSTQRPAPTKETSHA